MSDALLDLMRILRPRATLFGGLEGFGEWGLEFRKRNDLLFCWVERGECLVVRNEQVHVRLQPGDFLLIGTWTPFRLASSVSATPIDSEAAARSSRGGRLRLGSGDDRGVIVHAGKFVVAEENDDLLNELIPKHVMVSAAEPSAGRIQTLLAINESESRSPGPATEFVITRLVELILVEVLRSALGGADSRNKGLLAGMADSHTQEAIAAIHRDVAREWTVAELAKLCGQSRAGFALNFKRILGVAPIEYLLRWRIALAKDRLRRGDKTVAEIAFEIGFGSSSAFSSAFKRIVGCPPTQFVRAELPPKDGYQGP